MRFFLSFALVAHLGDAFAFRGGAVPAVSALRMRRAAKTLVMAEATSRGPGMSRRSSIGAAAGAALGSCALRKNLIVGPSFDKSVDMTGKTVVITGANTGLGKETALALARMGADVILACRDPAKANKAVDDIRAAVGEKALVEAAPLDLASLASVDDFAKELSARRGKLDVLINNAGVMAVPTRQLTKDGFELTLGVNHFGHFRLTSRLMDLMKKAEAPRVVTLSSSAHEIPPGVFNFEDPFYERSKYQPWPAYGQSKLANIYFTTELAKREPKLTATAVHPGACRTDLGRYILGESPNPLLLPLLLPLTFFTKSAEEGAQQQIACAADPALAGGAANGKYFTNLKEASTSAAAKDTAAAVKLWELSEKLVGTF